MCRIREQVFPAVLAHLQEILDYAAQCALETGISTIRNLQIQLAVEEAVVNVINYAYPENPGRLWIKTWCEHNCFFIEIIDQGMPFNPLLRCEPDIKLSQDQRELGGLGVHFLRKFTDQVAYQRKSEQNIITMTFSLENKD